MKALIVVDMQNDFIDGALGTPEAEAIVDNVKTKIE
ncbi:MAG: isochorismatase family protein, partial [Firmicutes bacterium]|nr:isochorismatase family protein [Bacillota bacterium]